MEKGNVGPSRGDSSLGSLFLKQALQEKKSLRVPGGGGGEENAGSHSHLKARSWAEHDSQKNGRNGVGRKNSYNWAFWGIKGKGTNGISAIEDN